MRSKTACLALVAMGLCCRPSPAAADPLAGVPGHFWFDLDVHLGLGTDFTGGTQELNSVGSVRAGVTLVWPYWILSMGVIARMLDFDPAERAVGIGGQVEAIHISSGVSTYAGPYSTLAGRPGFVVGLGWAILALELDTFTAIDGTHARWFVKLRIPISVGAYALWRRRRLRAGRRK